MKALLVKDGYHVTCTVSSNFLLDNDKGYQAKNLYKSVFVILLYCLLPYGGTISTLILLVFLKPVIFINF